MDYLSQRTTNQKVIKKYSIVVFLVETPFTIALTNGLIDHVIDRNRIKQPSPVRIFWQISPEEHSLFFMGRSLKMSALWCSGVTVHQYIPNFGSLEDTVGTRKTY